MDNYMKLEFDANSSNESFARVSIAAFVVRLDPTLEEISDIKTALSEAVTNAIIHGYENIADGIVWVECRIKDDTVEIKVSDKGRGIENVEKAMEPLYTSHPEMERSGMGFTVMETFMDSVEVNSKLGEGTRVKMVKTIRQK
ncbi:MAG: anti-sigma F factor [Ruminococcaceae bacterium]|nr:anti-sigma F factor [Oscillospiraceae bacterium]